MPGNLSTALDEAVEISSAPRGTVAVLTDDYVGYQRYMIDTIAGVLREAGYGLLCISGQELETPACGHRNPAVCNEIFRLADRAEVQGVIVLSGAIGRRVDPATLGKFFARFDRPSVSLGILIEGVPSIVVDDRPGMQKLMEHVLADDARRTLAFLRGVPSDTYSREREDIFRAALSASGRDVDETLFIAGNYDTVDAYTAVAQLLKQRPDVDTIVAANDLMALSAAQAATDLGRVIPGDIAITGFDDTVEATRYSPALTTVRQPVAQLAEVTARCLLEQLQDGVGSNGVIRLPTELVPRGSTMGARSADAPYDNTSLYDQLTAALTGLDTPYGVDLFVIAEALEESLATGSSRLHDVLGTLAIAGDDAQAAHWFRELCHQIDVVSQNHLDKSDPRAVLWLRGMLSTLRGAVSASMLAGEFKARRNELTRSSLQLAMGSCTSLSDMLHVLEDWLLQARPRRFYLVKYHEPTTTVAEKASLLHVSRDGQTHVRTTDESFSPSDILPPDLANELNVSTLVLYPICAGYEHFGYLLIDPEGLDLAHTYDSAQSIANAMRNQWLIETLESQALALQLTNKELTRIADVDALTGLPNRRRFERHLASSCAALDESLLDGGTVDVSHQGFTLCFLDLDGFKAVNDTLGHECGDLLLCGVAERLRSVVSSHVGTRGFIARLGGDEFTLVVHGIQDDEMQALARELIDELARAHELDGNVVVATASLGYACCPEHATDARSLLKAADAAMYQAKAGGKKRSVRYREATGQDGAVAADSGGRHAA